MALIDTPPCNEWTSSKNDVDSIWKIYLYKAKELGGIIVMEWDENFYISIIKLFVVDREKMSQ